MTRYTLYICLDLKVAIPRFQVYIQSPLFIYVSTLWRMIADEQWAVCSFQTVKIAKG